MQWHQVTCLFGGTFDPPHLGHREAVRGLFEQPRVARVVIMPSAIPPQKSGILSTEHRLKMTELNFQGMADVEISTFEIEKAARTGKPGYTYETLLDLQSKYPKLAFVIGTDQLTNVHTWSRFPALLGLSHWIVLERKPDGEKVCRDILNKFEASGLLKKVSDRLWEVTGSSPTKYLALTPTEAPEISSTTIRETLARTGQAPEGTLHEPVARYLNEKLLYGTQS